MRTYLLLVLLALSSLVANSQNTLKVITFNIRNSGANDGINSWQNRRPIVSEFLNNERPDIIGMQEVLPDQLDYLNANLKGYGYQGVAREDGKKQGEYAPIFYRNDRFSVKKQQTIWLSATPAVVGSVGWDAALTRIATIVTLYDKKSRKEVVVINTHFDHMGVKAREESAKLLRRQITELAPKYYMLMGDFNSQPTEKPYLVATDHTEGLLPLLDARTCSKTAGTDYTFHAYGNSQSCVTIDYILTSPSLTATGYRVMAIKKGDVFISDHYPVVTNLRYTKVATKQR